MNTIQLRITGDQAASSAVLLQQFLVEEYGIETQTLATTTQSAGDHKIEAGTALGIISIALSLPGFLESKMVSTLSQRIQAKLNFEKLIDWSMHQLPTGNTSIWVELDGKPFLLNADNLAEILNALPESSQ